LWLTTDRFAMTAFGGWNVNVGASDALAIVLTTGADGNYGWSTACCYSGGEMFLSRGSGFTPADVNTGSGFGDFMFRTYVDPIEGGATTPEPNTLLLLGTAAAAALLYCTRRPSFE
jgi:hypothetical protein